MSHKALSWAWGVQGLPSTQKFLLVALADFADELHSCFPGQEKLAGMIGVQRQAVSRNLGELEKAGFISREQRRRRDGYRSSDRFVLAVDEMRSCPRIVRTPDDDLMSAKQGDKNNQRTTSKNPPIVPQASSELALAGEGDAGFDEFWSVYPLKKDKGTARRAFTRALKKVPAVVLIAGASAYRDDPNREVAFTKHPSTWLNAEAWDNGPLPPRGRPGVVQSGRDADAILRARAAERAAIEGTD